jgi:ketosteroid isomerase-like protein
MNAAAEREILRLEREQAGDFNRRDMEALLNQFQNNFVGFSSTKYDRIAGRAALKRTFEHYLDQSPQLRYSIKQPRVQMFGNTAVVSFYWTVDLSSKKSKKKIQGRGTHVFVRRGKQWQIAHEHFSRSH